MLQLETGQVNFVSQSITRTDGRNLRLSALEAKLLDYLATRPGTAVGRDELMEAVWAYNPTSASRTLDVTVFRLRTKIEQDPAHPKHIITVYGHGYRFVPHEGPAIAVPEPITGPRFVGRKEEIRRLKTLCKYGPLLATVTGPPGVGKSRMARENGRLLGAEGYAIITCSLADADTLETLARAVASAFGLSMRGQAFAQVSAAVAEAIRNYPGRTVLILDGADRVLGPIAVLAPAWIAAGAAVVCTSRERIACTAEEVIDLGPLSDAEAAQLYSAVAGNEVDSRIEALVAHLDGLPLAIEIAAGHPEAITATDIKALGSALEASWDVLSADEQRALCCFTTFRGGFDLPAAEAILGPDDGWMAFDLLDRLDRCSLVSLDRHRRFDLLESVRAFAANKADDDTLGDARDLHAAHYLSLAAPILEGRGRYPTNEVDVRTNIANLVEVSTWKDRPRQAALAVLALRHAMLTLGAHRELFQRVTAALEELEIDDTLRARLLYTRAVVGHTWRVQADNVADIEAALALLDADAEPAWYAEGLIEAASIAIRERRTADAQAMLERARPLLLGTERRRLLWRYELALCDTLILLGDAESLAAARRAQDLASREFNGSELAWSFWREATCCLYLGDPIAGVAANRRSLELARASGDVRLERIVAGSLAVSLQHLGQTEESLATHQQALELHRISGCTEDVAIGLGNIGNVYQELGEMALAMEHYERALKLNIELGSEGRVGVVLGSRAMAYHRMGDLEAADEGYRESAARLEPANRNQQLSYILCFQALLAADRGLDDQARQHLDAAATTMTQFTNTDIEAAHRLVSARLDGDLNRALRLAEDVMSPVVRAVVDLIREGHRG